MEILSKEEIIRRHRELWNKIAELLECEDFDIYDYKEDDCFDPENFKRYALYELKYNEWMPSNSCFCCEYDSYFQDDCKHCPIKWERYENGCARSEYGLWFYALRNNDIKQAAEIARVIANLPEREGA